MADIHYDQESNTILDDMIVQRAYAHGSYLAFRKAAAMRRVTKATKPFEPTKLVANYGRRYHHRIDTTSRLSVYLKLWCRNKLHEMFFLDIQMFAV